MTIEAILPAHIDSTMMSCFRACPRRFYYEFILGLRPAGLSGDLHAGGCFATALERYYKAVYVEGATNDTALQRALGAFLNAWGDFEPIKDTPKTRDNVWQAVEDYFKQWSPATDPVQPFRDEKGEPSMEFTFAIPLEPAAESGSGDTNFPLHPVTKQPFIYSGRFDMLGIKAGRIRWRDEKTTKGIGANWAEQWDLRSQFLGYTWALQQSGIKCDGGIVRGIGILKTKITLVEAEKIYSNVLIARWHEQLRRDLWRLRRMWDEGYWDYNLADACTSYGGCAFRLPCSSEEPSRWYSGYNVRRWNPILKNPVAEESVAEGAKGAVAA
jgi:hypothetical protein